MQKLIRVSRYCPSKLADNVNPSVTRLPQSPRLANAHHCICFIGLLPSPANVDHCPFYTGRRWKHPSTRFEPRKRNAYLAPLLAHADDMFGCLGLLLLRLLVVVSTLVRNRLRLLFHGRSGGACDSATSSSSFRYTRQMCKSGLFFAGIVRGGSGPQRFRTRQSAGGGGGSGWNTSPEWLRPQVAMAVTQLANIRPATE